MAEPITVTLQAGTVILMIERAFAIFIAPRMRSKGETGDRRSIDTTGEKDPAYWKGEIREALDEKLDQRVMPIMKQQSEILESVARTQEGIATLVKELVDTSRKRRR